MSEQPRRVQTRENKTVNGLALCCDSIYDEKISATRELRARQAAYRKSLPTEPEAAIRAALDILQPGTEELPDGLEHAMHLSFALEAILKNEDFGNDAQWQETAAYLSYEAASAIRETVEALHDMSEILHNPKRAAHGQ